MKCSKTLILLLAAVFMMTTAVPIFAWDGGGNNIIIEHEGDHPWQDDNDNDTDPILRVSPTIIVGPIVATIGAKLTDVIRAIFGSDRPKVNKPKAVKVWQETNGRNFKVARRNEVK